MSIISGLFEESGTVGYLFWKVWFVTPPSSVACVQQSTFGAPVWQVDFQGLYQKDSRPCSHQVRAVLFLNEQQISCELGGNQVGHPRIELERFCLEIALNLIGERGRNTVCVSLRLFCEWIRGLFHSQECCYLHFSTLFKNHETNLRWGCCRFLLELTASWICQSHPLLLISGQYK